MNDELETSSTEAVEPVEKSLRETIEEAMVAEPVAPLEQAEPVAEPIVRTDGRDEAGKFAARAVPAEIEPAVELSKAPEAWKPEAKAHWDKLPPEVQKYVSDREAEVHKGFTRFDEDRQFGKQIKDIVSPYLPLIRSQGGNPVTAVQGLLQTAYLLNTAPKEQKATLIRQLAEQHGVLESLAQPAQYVDPQVAQLQARLQQLEGSNAQQAQEREAQSMAGIQHQIAAFAADPKNAHFEHVRGHMVAMLQGGVAKDLQDAYEQAVWARPDLRQALISEQVTQQQASAQQASKDRAIKARSAGASVSGSPGVVVPIASQPNRSLREELQANLRAHAEGV